MAISVLSEIMIPTPVRNSNAVSLGYADEKYAVLSGGKLSADVLPSSALNNNVVCVNSLGGETGPILVDSQCLKITESSGVKTLSLNLLSGGGLSKTAAGLQVTVSGVTSVNGLSNAVNVCFIYGTSSDELTSSSLNVATSYMYHAPDISLDSLFGGDTATSFLLSQDAIAPVFSSGTTYSVGDVVTKNGWLFRCIASTSTFSTDAYDYWERITVKDYVDDKAVCAGNKLRFLRKVFTTQNQTNSLVIDYSTYGFASNSVFARKMENYAGFCWVFLGRAATLTHPVRLPTIDSSTLGSSFETTGTSTANGASTALTYECTAMVKAPSSGSYNITFDFQDESGNAIEWIGTKPQNLARGKIYFFVLRNIVYDTEGNRKWIGNMQGEVVCGPTPTS